MPDHQTDAAKETLRSIHHHLKYYSYRTSFLITTVTIFKVIQKRRLDLPLFNQFTSIVCFSCRAQRACFQILSHNDGKPCCVWDTQKPSVSSHFYNSCSQEQQTWNGIFLNQVWDKTQSRFPSLYKHPHPGLLLCLVSFKVLSSPKLIWEEQSIAAMVMKWAKKCLPLTTVLKKVLPVNKMLAFWHHHLISLFICYAFIFTIQFCIYIRF